METLALNLVKLAIVLSCIQIIFLMVMICQNAIKIYNSGNTIVSEYIAFRNTSIYSDIISKSIVNIDFSDVNDFDYTEDIYTEQDEQYKQNEQYENCKSPNILGTYSAPAA